MAEKKLSDEEIFKIIDEFESLSPEERSSRIIGDVRSKTAYQIPNTPYILKEATPISEKLRGKGIHKKTLVEQYIASKQANKINDLVSQPILVNRPEKDAYLIQKRLEKITPEKASDLAEYNKKVQQSNFGFSDLSNGNIGLDSDGQIRGFDVHEDLGIRDNPTKTKTYKKTREEAVKKILNSKAAKIFRSVNIPLISSITGLAAAALSGEANAASGVPGLSEAQSLGPEQGSEDYEIENPQTNPELRKAALQKLMER